jgi:hypothetical protein
MQNTNGTCAAKQQKNGHLANADEKHVDNNNTTDAGQVENPLAGLDVEMPSALQEFTPSQPLKPEELGNFRVEQGFDDNDVVDVSAPIEIRRPGKDEYFRAHPDGSFRGLVIVDPDTGEPYLVSASAAKVLAGEGQIKRHVLACQPQG